MAKLLAIVVLSVLGAAFSHPGFSTEEELKGFMVKGEECRAEVGAVASDIDDIIHRKPAGGMEAKCLRSCLMKKYKVMDGNGKFVKAVAMEHADKIASGNGDKLKMGEEIIDACVGIAVPADHCEAAEVYGKCFHEQAKARNLDHVDF